MKLALMFVLSITCAVLTLIALASMPATTGFLGAFYLLNAAAVSLSWTLIGRYFEAQEDARRQAWRNGLLSIVG